MYRRFFQLLVIIKVYLFLNAFHHRKVLSNETGIGLSVLVPAVYIQDIQDLGVLKHFIRHFLNS